MLFRSDVEVWNPRIGVAQIEIPEVDFDAGSRTEIVMLKPPGDGTRLELSSFVTPEHVPNEYCGSANQPWFRFVVEGAVFTVGP